MSKLKELERRLKDEPENLGLRVMVAGALLEAGRRADAVALYHSVAIAYRDHGRTQQAITVCRSLLELAPEHAACQALLATLTAETPAAEAALDGPAPGESHRALRLTPPQLPPPSEPFGSSEEAPHRRSASDVTPLPSPLPYHEADPTWVAPQLTRADLPPSLQRELAMIPEIEGIAQAASQISAALLAARPLDPPDDDDAEAQDSDVDAHVGADADELGDSDDGVELTDADDGFDLRRRARMDPHAALEHLGTLRPTVPLGRPGARLLDDGEGRDARDGSDDAADEDGDDELTLPPNLGAIPRARAEDDDKTIPREVPTGTHVRQADPDARERSRALGDATGRASAASGLLEALDRTVADPPDALDALDSRTDQLLAPESLDSRTDHQLLAPESLDSRTDHQLLAPDSLDSLDSLDALDSQTDHAPLDAWIDPEQRAPERLAARDEHGRHAPERLVARLVARDEHGRHAPERLEARADHAHAAQHAAYVTEPPLPIASARPASPPRVPAAGSQELPRVPAAGSQELPRVPAIGSQELPRIKPPAITAASPAVAPLESALFASVPPRNRVALLQRFRRRIAAIGTTVIRRGETGHGLVFVVRGQLDVHAERADGARVSLEAIGAGDYCGEIGLVSRTPAAAYVVAVTESELLVLDAPDFYEVAGQFPLLWAAITAVAARRKLEHAERLQV
jgi:hypothetical protein